MSCHVCGRLVWDGMGMFDPCFSIISLLLAGAVLYTLVSHDAFPQFHAAVPSFLGWIFVVFLL